MLIVPELITTAVLQQQLKYLAQHPTHLQFMLGMFNKNVLGKLVGPHYVKQAIDMISNNRIMVAPYYDLDMKHVPRISLVSSHSESQMYLGDIGTVDPDATIQQTLAPVTYAEFDVKSISGDTLFVSANLNLDQTLFPGLTITNNETTRVLQGVLVRTGQDTQLVLNQAVDTSEVSLRDWKAQSGVGARGFVLGASTDDVTVQARLNTNGDPTVHRLLALVVRNCLKRGRLWFDLYGLQVATIAQTPMIAVEDTEIEYETLFTIQGKSTDHWVIQEFDTPEFIEADTIADAQGAPGRTDVDLG